MSSMVTQNLGNLRIVTGNIVYTTGVPALTCNDGSATIADTGTGIATVTFAQAFTSAPAVVCQVRKGTEAATFNNLMVVDSVSATVLVLRFKADSAGTNSTADPADTDGGWFIAIGTSNQ